MRVAKLGMSFINHRATAVPAVLSHERTADTAVALQSEFSEAIREVGAEITQASHVEER